MGSVFFCKRSGRQERRTNYEELEDRLQRTIYDGQEDRLRWGRQAGGEQHIKQRSPKDESKRLLKMAATYSPTTCSTIGVAELNDPVRNGKGWDLSAITT